VFRRDIVQMRGGLVCLALAVIVIVVVPSAQLLFRLPRTPRVIIGAAVWIVMLWLLFGSRRKSKSQHPRASSV